MPTDSEQALANWITENSALNVDDWFSASDDEKRAIMRDIANRSYVKNKTEAYIKTVEKLWADVSPIVNVYAEEKSVEPKLQRLETRVAEVNTRRELNQTREQLTAIPREKLSLERGERYDRIQGTLNTIEQVITTLEEERAVLSKAPLITSEEKREQGVSELLREARREGITEAGGSVVATPNVRYRSGVEPRSFTVRQYPISYDEKTGKYTDEPRYRVYGEGVGYIGSFKEKPTAREIRERWRS